jgi:hypothetical protein
MVDHHACRNGRTSRVPDEHIDAHPQCLHQQMQAVGHAAHGHACTYRQRTETMPRQIHRPHLCVFGQWQQQIAPCVARCTRAMDE